MPASLPGAQGYYQALYYDSTHEESLLRTTAEMLEDKDRENRALRLELFNTRADHSGHIDSVCTGGASWIFGYARSLSSEICSARRDGLA